MKLIKLKCPSCGANLEVDREKKKFICNYCRTELLLDDEVIKIEHTIVDKNKETALNIFKGFGIAWIVSLIFIGLIILGIIGTIIYFVVTLINKNLDDSGDGNSPIVEKYDEFDINRFNNRLDHYSGTEATIFVNNLLDEIVTINKTDKKRMITVIYKDKNTIDPDEIVDIKHSLEKYSTYEIYLDYDDIGFINKVTIEELK